MLPTKVKPVKVIISNSSSIDRSLKPLLVWMQLISIDLLNSYKPTLGCRGISYLIYQNVLLLATITVNVGMIAFLIIYHSSATPEAFGQTPTWNFFIDVFNTAIHCIAVHVLISFVLMKKWNKLYQSLRVNEHLFDGDDSNRRLSIFAVIYIIFWVISCQ